MKAPAFWWRRPGLAARLLQPASLVYGAVAASRMERAGARAPVPVICIGNVTVGGSGKTPTAIHVAALLRSMGRHPVFLTRGYGGGLAGPVGVDPARHGFREVGDEALLLARQAPTVVSRDRPAGAALAASLGADVIVMDDGLQNPSLEKDLAIGVFDGSVGIGNGLALPAGPLRAPLAAQWPKIGGVLVVGRGDPGERLAREASLKGLPVVTGVLQPDPEVAASLRGRRVLAFAGIGRPEKFFDTLREIGAEVAETRSFPDHHPYREGEATDLVAAAAKAGLVPVTTEKDAVRLAGMEISEPRLRAIATLPVGLVPDDEADAFQRLLAPALARR
ncbi:tetraacyldisaccharide 4'-kinase [Enterovirga aerilata]|uniref:Tetraacyldisaccharide 4'-kinase n=1 Tax=Enterovirga aerilata TaxID=2730920 RepID=A0A849I0U0_9HYPH|nr:tetraacyldisaccharide 4'-kinase [Enterovirga sp. DB1703]